MNPALRADRLREAHNAHSLPVDVYGIARAEGIAVLEYALDDATSGLIVKAPDGTVTIGVNIAHAKTRRRFTVAHELGHFKMHNGGAEMFVDKRDRRAALGIDKREIEANRFAAALLMPEPLLYKMLGGDLVNASDASRLQELAEDCAVSLHAMMLRLSALNLLFDDAG